MKLFKKVSAAILAGVMALSMMVGCAANVTPDTPVNPDVKPDASDADVVLAYINAGRRVVNATEPSNNEALAAKAAAILDAFTEREASVKTDNGYAIRLKVLDQYLRHVNQQLTGTQRAWNFRANAVTTVNPNGRDGNIAQFVTIANPNLPDDDRTPVELNNVFGRDYKTASLLVNFGTFYASATSVGVATKAINGVTYYMVVTNA